MRVHRNVIALVSTEQGRACMEVTVTGPGKVLVAQGTRHRPMFERHRTKEHNFQKCILSATFFRPRQPKGQPRPMLQNLARKQVTVVPLDLGSCWGAVLLVGVVGM